MITPSELNYCYRVLDLKPGASLEVVDQAYKDLAFIWHPDRIPEENQRLRKLAEEKLKEINFARDKLRSLLKRNTQTPRYKTAHQNTSPSKTYSPQTKRSTVSQPQARTYQRPPVTTQPPTPPRQPQTTPASTPQKSAHSATSSHYPPKNNYQRPSPQPNLSGVNLRGADLKERDFSGRNLSGADLSDANLSDAFLHKVNLSGACLYKANLFRANFLQADLSYANLQEANLIGADLSGADLRGANLTGAKVGTGDRIMVKLTGTMLGGAILPDGSVHP